MHSYSDEVEEPVCQVVLQVGYRHGDRVLRPARVAVAEPSASAGPEEPLAAPTADDQAEDAESVREVSDNSQ
jgi:molecular chaperone GrpE